MDTKWCKGDLCKITDYFNKNVETKELNHVIFMIQDIKPGGEQFELVEYPPRRKINETNILERRYTEICPLTQQDLIMIRNYERLNSIDMEISELGQKLHDLMPNYDEKILFEKELKT